MLLSDELSQVPLWTGTPEERIQRGKDLAKAIVSNADVLRWKEEGHTVMRGCYASGTAAMMTIQITGPKGLKYIELTHTGYALTGKIGATDLNGSTPTTAEDLIRLIDTLVQ